MSVLHSIAHRLGWYYGTVESWWEGKRLMVGFRCSTCGLVSGIHESYTTRKEPRP